MRPHDRIEEPPPIPRYTMSPSSRHGSGIFVDWRGRFFGQRPRLQFNLAPRPGLRRAMVFGLVALAVIALQAWTLHGLLRVRDRLAVEGAELDQARRSLALLWELTERVDEEQMAGLGQLADSIRSVFAYAQGEVRLWEAAYYAQEQRLDENAASIGSNAQAIARVTNVASTASTRVDELARADVAKASRLDALERQDRMHGAAVETLARRTEAQEENLFAVSADVGSMRETLAGLDAELAGLEGQVTSTGSAFGEMDTRVGRLDGWIDGFRRAGLSGEAVQSRLTTLANELRRVTMRVDSLRTRGATVLTSQQEH